MLEPVSSVTSSSASNAYLNIIYLVIYFRYNIVFKFEFLHIAINGCLYVNLLFLSPYHFEIVVS